jgi:hypothetical protein
VAAPVAYGAGALGQGRTGGREPSVSRARSVELLAYGGGGAAYGLGRGPGKATVTSSAGVQRAKPDATFNDEVGRVLWHGGGSRSRTTA